MKMKKIKERYSVFMDWKIIVGMSIVSKVIYSFNALSIKIPMMLFTELEQIILKFISNRKDPKLSNQP